MAESVSRSGGTGITCSAPGGPARIVPPSVPSAIVKTWMPADCARSAPCPGLRSPRVCAPSESSRIEASERPLSSLSWPPFPPSAFGPAALRASSTALASASPSAVPNPGPSTSMPCESRARSIVGGTTTCGSSENETTPTRSDFGARSRNERIAFFAAASRVGFTSVARIEPEVSTTRTTLARSFGAFTVMVGRASATQSAASDASISAAGTCLRHARRRPATAASTSRFV
jgi:hypothetical protein